MNLTQNIIRSIILEQVDELFSAENQKDNIRLSRDSADDQIDAFIIKFERDSVVQDAQESQDSMSESLLNLSLDALIFEQDEDLADLEEPTDEPADEPAPDEGEGEDEEADDPEPAGSEDVDVDEPEQTPKMPLDVDSFTKRVARLAMNVENLLDMKTIIVNRAMNFIKDNYDEAHVDEMKEILDTQFDFNLDGGKDIPHAPYAVGAYAGGTGGLGGGGGG